MTSRRVLLIQHFFHPDDVVNARLYTGLAVGLRARGWTVTVLTSDRVWSQPERRLAREEEYAQVQIHRVHRPAWTQSDPKQRLANAAWLGGAWALRAASMARPDVVIVGSDPAFAATLAIPLRRLWPQVALVHWCHDVFPEAIAADGDGGGGARAFVPLARRLMSAAYRRFDALVDIGPEMRVRLAEYETAAVRATIPPWALIEPAGTPRPPNGAARAAMFGDARLALLYSGALGRAHDLSALIDLARACRARFGNRVGFCFACRGHRLAELQSALGTDDTNVRRVPFCREEVLDTHLEAADLHLVSLRSAWGGLSVPSKFFGALAAGRPVVYAGPARSDIGRWIERFQVGYMLREDTTGALLSRLEHLAESPADLLALQESAKRTYFAHFRRELAIEAWDRLLSSVLADRIRAARAPRA